MKAIFTINGFLALALLFTGCATKIDTNITGKEDINISNTGISIDTGASGSSGISISNSGISISSGYSGGTINVTESASSKKTDISNTDSGGDNVVEGDTTIDSSMLEQDEAMNTGMMDDDMHMSGTSGTSKTNTGVTIQSTGANISINNTRTQIEVR